MSIMEAESVGRPIITTDNVGCRDTVVDGYNGFLIEKNNVQQLVEKIEEIINNIPRTMEMGKNSRLFAEEHFDQKSINKQILSIIDF